MYNDIRFSRRQPNLILEQTGTIIDESLIDDIPETVDRATDLWASEWTNNENNGVYELAYEFHEQFPEGDRAKVREHVKDFERVTCVKMVEIEEGVSPNYGDFINKIRVVDGAVLDDPAPGCWSYVGRTGWSSQDLSLSSWCTDRHTTQHEFVHALGFWHEQQARV